MEWNNSHKNPPVVGQKIYYFGPEIGLWIGEYKYEESTVDDVELCPHIFFGAGGYVDACDAPFWLPYDAEKAACWVPLPPVIALHPEEWEAIEWAEEECRKMGCTEKAAWLRMTLARQTGHVNSLPG
jgi:hypothetical protein